MDATLLILVSSFFVVAALYAMTGHGGGSGYIAVMVLLSMAPAEIKPLALALNLIVSSIGTYQFYRAGHFRRELFLPFIIASVPFAMLGGYLQLPTHWFNLLLGLALIFAALRIAVRPSVEQPKAPPLAPALFAGSLIGLMSGLIGVGGGILLTPLLLLMGWALPRQAAAVSAPFILLNSIAALIGFFMHQQHALPLNFAWFALAVLLGGSLGAYLGSRKLGQTAIARVLSAVLILGGIKLLYV